MADHISTLTTIVSKHLNAMKGNKIFHHIDNVKSHKYPGITISAKKTCSLTKTPNDLSVKTSRAHLV